MLGLTEHIGSRIDGICRLICHDENLTWTCQHVDITVSVNFLFRQCDKDIARPRDLIDTRNCLCAKCHGGNRLCTANLIDALHACFTCSNEDVRINLSVLRRNHHDDFTDTRHRCRHCVHDDGGRICRCAARHIDTDAVERNQRLSENRALLTVCHPRVRLLFLMILADICRRLAKRHNYGRVGFFLRRRILCF